MARKKAIKTIVAFILDKSGSMGVCRDSAISGFNEYLQTTKNQNKKGSCTFNLTLFDTEVYRKVQNLDVHEVPELTTDSFTPNGTTALYDAVVETVEGLATKVEKMEEAPAVLVAIMTDGEENASREHNEQCLQDLIKDLQAKGNWTFVFMGANQDSYSKAQKMGISLGNAMNWEASLEGTKSAFRSMAMSGKQYADGMVLAASTGMAMNTSDFFGGGDKNDTQS